MYRFFYLLLICLLYTNYSFATSDSTVLRCLSNYVRNIEVFSRVFPQEKVYLHLDNTSYYKGETIWYKAYVVRPDSAGCTNLSRVLYVELVGPQGEVLERQKVALDQGRGQGSLSLDKRTMLPGFCELRAYTRYMTNWDASGIYSRVIPIYSKPKDDGDYRDRLAEEINHLNHLLRTSSFEGKEDGRRARERVDEMMNYFCRPDTMLSEKTKRRLPVLLDESRSVDFFPEGGSLVRGLSGLVAFSVDEASALADTTLRGYLMTAAGDTLERVSTLHEGRGQFRCTPGDVPLFLGIPDRKGKLHRFPLPAARDTGCVLSVDVHSPHSVRVSVSGSSPLRGSLLGLTLLHHGRLLSFDTVRVDTLPCLRRYDRSRLPAGVHQLTLFDREGRIHAERLFFVAPRDTLQEVYPIRVDLPPTISPYGPVELSLHAAPRSSFSLSVCDAATLKQGGGGTDIAASLLLSSEVKGYIRNASYYLESDDAVHRRNADLLMLVQGWRRYDWRMMSGRAPFVKQQPIEDGLYLDGQLRQVKADYDPEDVKLQVVLKNPRRTRPRWMMEEFRTGKDGYFAFKVPDIEGDWGLVLSTKKNNLAQKYTIAVDRLFSPPVRRLALSETRLLRPDTLHAAAPRFVPLDTFKLPSYTRKDIHLKTVTVKRKRKKDWREYTRTSRDMEMEEKMKGGDFIYYNSSEIADELADRGQEIPRIQDWLMEKPFFRYEVVNKDRLVIWIVGGKTHYFTNAANKSYMEDDPVETLADVRSIYLHMYEGHGLVHRGMGTSTITDIDRAIFDKAIIVEVYPRYTYYDEVKGLRHTHFQGYNTVQTFPMPDYSKMPLEPDHRRTLYWNPTVRTDKQGDAKVVFWNNASCRKLVISVEGILKDGTPALYNHQAINTAPLLDVNQ